MDPGTDVDHVLQALGNVGRYQKFQLSMLFVFMLENAFHLIAANYISYRPDYNCKSVNATELIYNQYKSASNISDIHVKYGKCEIAINANVTGAEYQFSQSCSNGYEYDIPRDRSTVTEWDLVCEGSARSELAQTLIMLGQAVGAAIFSPLSDRYGRRPINILSRSLYLIARVTAMFSPSIAVFSVFRLLIGTFQGGSVMTGTTMCVELLPTEFRHQGEGLAFLAWTLGIVFTSVVGYICQNLPWRYFQMILGLLSWHVVFDWLFLDESLRWLLANGKTKQAMKIIKKAASWNNQSFESVMESVKKKQPLTSMELVIQPPEKQESNGDHQPCEVNGTTEVKQKVNKYSAFTILKHKKILLVSVLLWVIWITNTLTYYGLMLMTSKLAGDRYLNNILGALAEVPAIILQQLIINRIGRRYVLVMYHGLAGVTLIASSLCFTYSKQYDWLTPLSTFFSILGRFAAVGSFSSVFLYTPELYPTNLRNVGLGMASTISRIGSMISPFAAALAEHVFWGPAVIFAVLNIICTVMLLTLPETMGRPLPTTVQEMKAWFKDKKLFDVRWPKHYRNRKEMSNNS